MPDTFLLTADYDEGWWLRLQLEGYESGLENATVSDATLGRNPLGDVGIPNGSSIGVFYAMIKSSSGSGDSGDWVQLTKVYYDSDKGAIDVLLLGVNVGAEAGDRWFVRVFAASQEQNSTPIAMAEIVNLCDKSREQDTGAPGVACGTDNWLSFRLADNAVDKVYIGPKLMSNGDNFYFILKVRYKGMSNWSVRLVDVYYDPLTNIVDCLVGDFLPAYTDGDSFEYELRNYSTNELLLAGEFEKTSEPGTCDDSDCPPPPPPIDYEIVAKKTPPNGESQFLLFKLRNFTPTPENAFVVSAALSNLPDQFDGVTGVFTFRYKIDDEETWHTKSTKYDDEQGIVAVDITDLIELATEKIDFELEYNG